MATVPNNRPIDFVIEENGFGFYTLYSIVDTDFGGAAKNFVADGTLEYVQGIQSKLALDELARIDQETSK